ncbi:MAG: EF-hand domain-containing protein [Cyanobacteria bacterium]|nr:EF-hand domain-containing protein [Cyanobacteriota bacterium]MDA0866379.1 EF-hand domain-containing protein [Cyanobacteriota bacterium]
MRGIFQRRKWIKIFTIYDTGNTGALRASDFERFAETLAKIRDWQPGSTEHHQLLNQFMDRWAHIQGTIQDHVAAAPINEISLENWVDYHRFMLDKSDQYPTEINAFAQIIFNVCDVDDSGNLDLDEWVTLFRAFGLPVVYAQEAFSSLDKNRDGSLQKEEVIAALNDFYYSDDPSTLANFMFGPY